MGRGNNRIIGNAGEAAALDFLKRNGYEIIETNFRTVFGELDVIARHKDCVVFVEVKTRLTSSLGPPYLSITRTKKRHIVRNALAYLERHHLFDSDWRIDVVSIKLNYRREIEDVEMIENAVEEDYDS